MRQIPDLMLCLQELNEGTVRRIRKTAEDPPRVAVYDVLQLITGCSAQNCSNVYSRVSEAFPEVLTNCSNFKFSGRGQRESPVADARTTVEIIMVLPGWAAARVRKAAADVMVGYLGEDPSLVEEVAANRLRQEEDDPARIFGQTVESETLRRKREEVTMVELEGRVKRARAQAATDVARLTLGALQELGLPTSDRDRMLAKDMITTAAFTQPGQGQLEGAEEDKEICLQQVCASRGKKGHEAALGKKAKKLYMEDHPGFQFSKKTIFAQGQLVEADRWTAIMVAYLERALQAL